MMSPWIGIARHLESKLNHFMDKHSASCLSDQPRGFQYHSQQCQIITF